MKLTFFFKSVIKRINREQGMNSFLKRIININLNFLGGKFYEKHERFYRKG